MLGGLFWDAPALPRFNTLDSVHAFTTGPLDDLFKLKEKKVTRSKIRWIRRWFCVTHTHRPQAIFSGGSFSHVAMLPGLVGKCESVRPGSHSGIVKETSETTWMKHYVLYFDQRWGQACDTNTSTSPNWQKKSAINPANFGETSAFSVLITHEVVGGMHQTELPS